MPIRNEEPGTSVLFLPWNRISTWNTDTCWVLRYCPGLQLDWKNHIFSLFPSSIAPLLCTSLLFSLCILNPAVPIFPRVILDVISQQGEQSKTLPNNFPPYSDHPSKIQSVLQKEHLCKKRDIPKWDHLPPIFPLSVLHGDLLTTSWKLWSTWLPNSTQRLKHFQPHSHGCCSKNQLSCIRPHL